MTRRPNASTSLRVPPHIGRLWEALAKKMGLNKTAVLIVALRDLAKKEGMPEPEPEEGEADNAG